MTRQASHFEKSRWLFLFKEEMTQEKRKRGRPKGSGNKLTAQIKEQDKTREVPDPQLEARKEVLNRCYRDLDFFDRTISPQTYYLKSPEIHKEWDELLLNNSIIQLLLRSPRGTAKSTKVRAKA